MTIRKSTRVRTLTSKVKESNNQTTNEKLGLKESEPQPKRRKITPTKTEEDKSDTIDPVEKLLSLTNLNNDILLNLDEEIAYDAYNISSSASSYSSSSNQIALNFTKILNDNLRSYYSNFKRCPIEIYNDNSSFAILNKNKHQSQQQEPIPQQYSQTPSDIPFFKNVNFNPKPQSSYTIDEYLSYDELTSDNESDVSSDDKSTATTSDPKSPVNPLPSINSKMSFHYRHNDNLNLSLNKVQNDQQDDVLKILNKRSILTGKASEMVSTGNFLINDFFL